MRLRRYKKSVLFCILFLVFMVWLTSKPEAATFNWKENLKVTRQTTIVPDLFLRRFDPVTIFFDSRKGPKNGGVLHDAQKYVSFKPEHPGVFEWLDDYTLQFRPVEPWPPLRKYQWQVKGHDTVQLLTLMPPPDRTIPADDQQDLDPIESITLYFPDFIAPESLAEMISLELTPLPGVEKGQTRILDKSQFDIKTLERADRSQSVGYVLTFLNPIAGNTRVQLKLKLALDTNIKDSMQIISFSTAEPFQITHIGASNRTYPVTPGGVLYDKAQALACSPTNRKLEIHFSSDPAPLDPIQGRNLTRFSPAVDGLKYTLAGKVLSISGQFKKDTLYRIDLAPAPIKDTKGRLLKMDGPSRLFFYLPPQADYLKWRAGRGIIERFGPQMIPIEGRGIDRLDVRIYPIDPLNRSLWPFPEQAIVIQEDQKPYAPGEEPEPYTNPHRHIYAGELKKQLKALGSPLVSTLTGIPLEKNGNAATFGFDVKPLLEKISGPQKPGTYLVGLRKLDGSQDRHYVRAQVTDLCLTAVEEARHIKFVVTSLKTGKAVAYARVVLEGMLSEQNNRSWSEIVSGKTDSNGFFTWKAPGGNYWKKRYDVRRIVVVKEEDVLVLDPTRPPDKYENNVWHPGNDIWCQWPLDQKSRYDNDRVNKLGHIFTERPVYKPDQPVHIKGYLRNYSQGEFSLISGKGTLVVKGPGRLKWRYPLTVNKFGSFYHKFQEPKIPTGYYSAYFEADGSGEIIGTTSFNIEAYRLPKFEINMNGPDIANLDEPFTVGLTAKYYAGGRVAEQPLRWRITQFPYTWTPEKREGYFYSTDARFSKISRFRAMPAKEKTETTDAEGSAQIEIDPTKEPTAQPRRYVIETTITGADDQTVSATHSILALPPFTLGLKIPRYIKNARSLEPEIIVVGAKGRLIAGQELKIQVLQRQWHSHLQAGDFSQGVAKYVTDVVDEKIFETRLKSGKDPLKLKIPIERAGVYIVEIDAQDQVGRTQSIAVDLFAGGDEPVTWQRPPTSVFKVTTEKKSYQPGDKAVLVLESPFQQARVLAVIEQPDGKNVYEWLNVKNGSATFEVDIEKQHMPRLPVHFILMRGRKGEGEPLGLTALDLGKPKTLAATVWVEVTPAKNRIQVDLKQPLKAQPGDKITVTLKLTDDEGKPLSGEATLWLVDQAVLALGTEQELDPIKDFIISRKSYFLARDTRNLIFGHFPLQEIPGGGLSKKMAMAVAEEALLNKVTVRKNFQPVPYYNPSIIVGEDGVAHVKVKLPDNLTNFKLRVKAVSGKDRFGFGKGHLAVRLPVIVQPSLPRFVRPGDRFTAIAIGRIVDGEGGAGQSQIRVEGLDLTGSDIKEITWRKNKPQRIEYQLSVPTPEYLPDGTISREYVAVTLGAERKKDKAKDAFSIKLPIQPDRKAVRKRLVQELNFQKPLSLEAIAEPVRKGTFKRSILLARHPGIVRMAAGLNYLMEYPHGCTEQRLSQARAQLAAKRFRDLMDQKDAADQLERVVKQTLEWIGFVKDNNNLASYWPGSNGNVSLTAWVVQFMLEAKAAGFKIDDKLLNAYKTSLKQALRSDYSHFLHGEAYAERCWALTALAAAGELDVAYATELARRSNYLNLESLAQVVHALQSSEGADEGMIGDLRKRLWDGIVLRLYQGREIYGGLQRPSSSSALILPSETRTVSEVLRAVAASEEQPRKQLLVDAIVTLGQSDGWGSTNADSAALLSLIDYMNKPDAGYTVVDLELKTAGKTTDTIVLAPNKSLKHLALTTKDQVTLAVKTESKAPLMASVETVYLPQAAGSQVKAHSQGFVIHRELLKIAKGDVPPERFKPDTAGQELSFDVGDTVEEHIELVNPKERYYVAVVVPIACGMEPLNPNLATAPPEAGPSGQLTLSPTYTAFMDDAMAFYYNTLPKGTYHFYFRTSAAIPGTYIQPSAYVEMMYDQAVNGHSNGARVIIAKKVGE